MQISSHALAAATLLILAAASSAYPEPVSAAGANAGTLAPPRYVEVTAAVGLGGFLHGGHVGADGIAPIFPELSGPGACWLDHDRDDDIDLYLVSGKFLTHPELNAAHDPHSRLYRNDGGTFVEQGGRLVGMYQGCSAADYDNDGWTDLYVLGYGGNVLLRNDGSGGFVNVTAALGVQDATCGASVCWSSSASWFDADRDGCLDVYVNHFGAYDIANPTGNGPSTTPGQANRLFRGSCGGPFTDVTAAAGLASQLANSWSSVAFDINGDAWPDLYVSNDGDENDLYLNDRDGTFTRISNEAADPRNGMGTAVGDINADGLVDLATTNYMQDTNGVFLGTESGGYVDIGVQAPFDDALPWVGWATTFLDADQDGRQDVMVLNGMTEQLPSTPLANPVLFYLNRGGASFEQARTFTGPAMLLEFVARGGAWGDYDNDGDVDVLVAEAGPAPTHLLEATRTSGNFLLVDLVGGSGVNRDAIGARVTVGSQMRERTAGDGYLSSSDPRLHFGLGHAETATVHVRWPDGTSQTFSDVRANSAIRLTKGLGSPVTLWEMPIVRLDGPAEAQLLVPHEFTATLVDSEAGPWSVSWLFPDGSTAAGASAAHSFAQLGPQHVIVSATADGVEKTQSIQVLVTDELEVEFAPDKPVFLPGEDVTATLRVLQSNGAPVAGATVSVEIVYTNGEAADGAAARLPKAARTALGYIATWANGTTDADGTFRFAVPDNVVVPQSFAQIGANAPGEYRMRATGEIHGLALPETHATARVGAV